VSKRPHRQTLQAGASRTDQAHPDSEPRYSLWLELGLTILACFTPERPVLGNAEIADTVGMSRSTTHRYARTLLKLGYLEQTRRRKYQLGTRVSDLGMSA
jgi:hypothetical protein